MKGHNQIQKRQFLQDYHVLILGQHHHKQPEKTKWHWWAFLFEHASFPRPESNQLGHSPAVNAALR
jgi:hypothetical protein